MKKNDQTEALKLHPAALRKLSKAKLIRIIFEQNKTHALQIAEQHKQITQLTEQLAEYKLQSDEDKTKEINKKVNEPSSKKPEWDRVKGKLWWLWIFANEHSVFYWVDENRGTHIVHRLLGEVFYGVLIVDGWHAYNKIICAKQSCMTHIFRKIRAFIDAYPQYCSIMSFYLKLRRIIKQGEKLQKLREELGEIAFHRRLKALQHRAIPSIFNRPTTSPTGFAFGWGI